MRRAQLSSWFSRARYQIINDRHSNKFRILFIMLLIALTAVLSFFYASNDNSFNSNTNASFNEQFVRLLYELIPGIIVASFSVIAAYFFFLVPGIDPATGASIDDQPGHWDIGGHWEMRDWCHDYKGSNADQQEQEEKRRKLTHTKDARLTQRGNFVEGFFSHCELVDDNEQKFERATYRISGFIEGTIFTAHWRQLTPIKSSQFYGVAQFVISDHGRAWTMLGRWTGVGYPKESSKNQVIRCGIWEWRQLTHNSASPPQWPSEEEDTSPVENCGDLSHDEDDEQAKTT